MYVPIVLFTLSWLVCYVQGVLLYNATPLKSLFAKVVNTKIGGLAFCSVDCEKNKNTSKNQVFGQPCAEWLTSAYDLISGGHTA